MNPIRVLIADDEPALRALLVRMIPRAGDIEIVGEAADAGEAIAESERTRPDVVLLDVRMPGGGPRAARGIHLRCPEARIVAFTAHADRAIVLDMLRAGAISYLLKGATTSDIVDAIRRAARDESVLSPDVAGGVVAELADRLADERRVCAHDDSLRQRLRDTIAQDRFDIVCQPIVELLRGQTVGYEALARFHGPPVQAADRWFAEAARAGLTVELERATAAAALNLLDRIPAATFLALNLSPASLTTLTSALGELGGDGRLVVEIPEHAALTDPELLEVTLKRLRRDGVRVAVDDAGAAFAGRHHALELTPHFVKLDISLTRDIDTDPRRQTLARGLVAFAGDLGADVVAEGVETAGELAALQRLGVQLGQGYLFGAPGPLPGGGQRRPRFSRD